MGSCRPFFAPYETKAAAAKQLKAKSKFTSASEMAGATTDSKAPAGGQRYKVKFKKPAGRTT
jgi:hypothetical protein